VLDPLTPDMKKKARGFIQRYCERAERTEPTKHYSQARPMTHLGLAPNIEWTADCSGYATGAFRWADKQAGFDVGDPNGLGYTGYGYTGTLYAENRRRRVPLDRKFFVGDMALYGPSLSRTAHVTICRKNGTAATAVWSSHGSERGPYPVRLRYRADLLCVVRSEALA
jgi:hypothetical protein